MILHELLDTNGDPIDFTRPALSKRIGVIRKYYRDIWEKLHDAGIEMKPVFWSREDKEKYERRETPKVQITSIYGEMRNKKGE
nr:MAG TPA: hypothetical protein [Caudoviricetes sp.]